MAPPQSRNNSTVSLMAMVMLMLLLLLAMETESSTCPPQRRDPSIDELVYFSDAVVQGSLLRRVNTSTDAAYSYVSQVKVFCVYKGEGVSSVIDIFHPGNQTGPCLNIERGDNVLLFLKQLITSFSTSISYSLAYPPLHNNYVDELSIICDLNIIDMRDNHPEGEDMAACDFDQYYYDSVFYPDGNDDMDCIRYIPTTTTTTTTTMSSTTTTDVPYLVVRNVAPSLSEDEEERTVQRLPHGVQAAAAWRSRSLPVLLGLAVVAPWAVWSFA